MLFTYHAYSNRQTLLHLPSTGINFLSANTVTVHLFLSVFELTATSFYPVKLTNTSSETDQHISGKGMYA